MALEPLLTIDEVAAIMGFNKKTVYAMIESGDISFAKRFGGGRGEFRFRREDLQTWISERNKDGKSERLETGCERE